MSVKNLVLKLLPGPLRSGLRAFKGKSELSSLLKEWEKQRDSCVAHSQGELPDGFERRVLLVPCDPWTVYGSVGDQAMLCASIDSVKNETENARFFILTASEKADEIAVSMGATPLRLWDRVPFFGCVAESVASNGIDTVYVLGADVLDGYYNPVVAAKLLLVADAAARSGAMVSILGFSFNKSPNQRLRAFFEGLHSSVNVNVRDPQSHARFSDFCDRDSRLVADSAFMLKPEIQGQTYLDLQKWVSERRQEGRVVFGVNFHPLLLAGDASVSVSSLAESVFNAIIEFSRVRANFSWVLISHDYRDRVGDVESLANLGHLLDGAGLSNYIVPGVNSASQLKGFAGLLDGVVTGRMHFAIASLGMGVPVLAFTYQDKFEGLFEHFSLPAGLLMSKDRFMDKSKLAAGLLDFSDNLVEIQKTIAVRLGEVKSLSGDNFRHR